MIKEIEDARCRDEVLYVEFHCRNNPSCSAREVVVTLKDPDGTALSFLRETRRIPTCPICRAQLTFHHVVTRSEQRRKVVSLILAEYAIYKLAGEESIAKALDALATKIEHGAEE